MQPEREGTHERRLQLMQLQEGTRYSNTGVIALDNTLIDHDGQLIDDVGWVLGSCRGTPQDCARLSIHQLVCTSGKHYPLDFRRFKSESYVKPQGNYFSITPSYFIELVDWVCSNEIPGDFTFDNYFSNVTILNHIDSQRDACGKSRAYVCDLNVNRKARWKGEEISVTDWLLRYRARTERRFERVIADNGTLRRPRGCLKSTTEFE